MPQGTHGYAAIRSTLLVSVLDRLIARGVATQPLLSQHGISLDMLKDPYAHLSLNEYVGFFENASKLSGDTHIGAHIGAEFRAGDLGPMGILLSLSRSIHVGIDRIAKSSAALQSGTEMTFLPNDDDMILTYQIEDGGIWPRRQDAEFSLVATVQVIRDNFLRRWSPQQVHFEHAQPEDDSYIRQYFRCPIQYGQATNRLVMDRASLMELYRVEDTAFITLLERHINDLIASTPHQSTLSDAVRGVVTSSLGLRAISVDRVAETLGLSPRNLQRKLSEEGTSLRDLLDDIRRDRATTLLSEGDIPVGEVAAALGYADGTAFWRAHKRWSKLTPREVRSGKGYRT